MLPPLLCRDPHRQRALSAVDVVQGLAVVEALVHLPDDSDRQQALKRLRDHPAHGVREGARQILARGPTPSHQDKN